MKPFTKKNIFRFTVAMLFLGIIGVVFVVENMMPYMPISPIRRTRNADPADLQNLQTLDIEVANALILRGYFARAKQPKATLILVHGIGGFKESFLGFARFLNSKNINVFLYDQRAHGKSDGKYCTFGYYEKKDISKIIDTIQKIAPQPIGIFGASLGGAVALQALAEDKRLQFGIIESTFNTLENVVAEYGKGYFGFRSEWLARHVLRKSAVIANFDPFSVRPSEACKQIAQPLFFAHGTDDPKIPMTFNKENFVNTASTQKIFYEVQGAKHSNLHIVGGDAYKSKLIKFIDSVIPNN
jgi:hypothetical protein